VSLAIDDFGTGYSSLSYVSKLPVDVLKIDRAFIVDMTESHENREIVSVIVALAHALRLKVVAEGVETERQAALLRSLGCDQMQGHLYSQPLPAAGVEALLAQELAARPA
jgi:EAL domain-containing protein (putative c-di-GMP-specific phosphodiesterase class I)